MNRLARAFARTCAAASLAAAAALPAQASFIYTLDVVPGAFGGHGDFTLTVDHLITTNTVFQLSDFDAIDPLPGTTTVTFEFALINPNDAQIIFQGPGQGLFWDYVGALQSVGTYCPGFQNTCVGKAAVLTITETTAAVPEPAPLALLGIAALAAALVRRTRR